MALTDPWSGKDDTHYGYYDTPSGNIWRPGPEPGQPPTTNPGGRRATGRTAALVPFPDRLHLASPPRTQTRTS
jgi:hypothetical protein